MAAKRDTAAAQRTGEYDVGYGKPPRHSQFKPGNSANPRGRPKGAKNKAPAWNHAGFDELVRQEAYRPMTINDNGRPVTLPMMQAVLRRVNIDALQGRSRAQKLIGDLLGAAERRDWALHVSRQEATITYKNEKTAILDECRRAGLAPPEMIPHPEDIIVDMNTGEVRYLGPRTPEEKAMWEILAGQRDGSRNLLANCQADLDVCEDPQKSATLRRIIGALLERVHETAAIIGEWPNHRLSAPGDNVSKVAALLGFSLSSEPDD